MISARATLSKSTLNPSMSLDVMLRARWRRALTSPASLRHYPFRLCSCLQSLGDLDHSTRSKVLMPLVSLLLLTLAASMQLPILLSKYCS